MQNDSLSLSTNNVGVQTQLLLLVIQNVTYLHAATMNIISVSCIAAGADDVPVDLAILECLGCKSQLQFHT